MKHKESKWGGLSSFREANEILTKIYLTKDDEELSKNLDEFYKIQYEHFSRLFKELKERGQFSINVRLLDYNYEEIYTDEMKAFIKDGNSLPRGTQLADQIPSLYEKQIEAIFQAAKDAGINEETDLGIMLPNVVGADQTTRWKEEIESQRQKITPDLPVRFGVMIENKEAINCADELAAQSDFISFGTNDLSADILGYSRRDRSYISEYMQSRGYDPSEYLADEVKESIAGAISGIKKANPNTKLSICGLQASMDMGMSDTIKFSIENGIDEVSVHPNPRCVITAKLLRNKHGLNANTPDANVDGHSASAATAKPAAVDRPRD